MEVTLGNTQAVVGIVASGVTVLGIVGGWIGLAVRRKFTGLKDAYDQRLLDAATRYTALESDTSRDIAYRDRQISDWRERYQEAKTDLAVCRADLRACEDRNGRGFVI